jgi:phage head maturation protease
MEINGTLVTFGDPVKALGDGKVGGYLVRFSTEQDPDLSVMRDFFTKDTDFDIEEWPAKSSVYYSHGLDTTLKTRKIGRAEMKMDDVGVWVEAQLNQRDEYEKAVYRLAKEGKLGWSSGTAEHLMGREPVTQGGKTIAHRITHWPIVEASLTPTPAEPRNQATPLKSVAVELLGIKAAPDGLTIGDFVSWPGEGEKTHVGRVEKVQQDGTIAVNIDVNASLYNERYSYYEMSPAAPTQREYQYSSSNVTVQGSENDPAALIRVYGEVVGEGWETTQTLTAANFSTLTKIDPPMLTGKGIYLERLPIGMLKLSQQSGLVLTAVTDYVNRELDKWKLMRSTKVGRKLSGANRSRIQTVIETMRSKADELEGLLNESEPATGEEDSSGETTTGQQDTKSLREQSRLLLARRLSS